MREIGLVFITTFCSYEESTWFVLLEWTFLNVIEKAKDRAVLLHRKRFALDEIAMSNVAHQTVTLKLFIGILYDSVQPGVHESRRCPWMCFTVLRVLKIKIQSRKSISFYPFIWVISQLNRTTIVVWHVHIASRLTFFIWFWWRCLAAGWSLKFASCQGGWDATAHAKKRPNLIYQ